jgi:hypothetical protein
MKPKKLKPNEPSSKDKLSADFTARLEQKWRQHGDAILDAACKEAPTKVAEMIARLISTTEPSLEGIEGAKDMSDLAFRMLKKAGCNEFDISEDMIEDVIAETNRHIDAVQAIAARAEAKDAGAMQ